MPATTPIYALRYQELGDAPHGPNLGQNLALDVEDELARIEKQRACVMEQTTAQGTTHATSFNLTLDATIVDTDGMADLAGDRMVVVTAGLYLLHVAIAFSPTTAGYARAGVLVNAAQVGTMIAHDSNNEAGLPTVVQAQAVRSLAVGAAITAAGLQTSGASQTTHVTAPYRSVLTAYRL